MEFIELNNEFYLIDVNPRFSAGVAFSVIAGYDMVNNHLRCFQEKDIEFRPKYQEMIITKKV